MNRREMFKVLSGVSCILATSVQSQAFQLQDNNLIDLLKKSWDEKEDCDPINYLVNGGVSHNSQPLQVRNVIKQEFRDDKTHVFNGLVLSKTEVALMISID